MSSKTKTLAARYKKVIDQIRKHAHLSGDDAALEDAIGLCGDLWAQVPEENKDSALLQTEEMLEELEL